MRDRKDDPLRPVQDTRGYFMLPQTPMDSGYYTYGKMDNKPDRGGYQYPHPVMMQAILVFSVRASAAMAVAAPRTGRAGAGRAARPTRALA